MPITARIDETVPNATELRKRTWTSFGLLVTCLTSRFPRPREAIVVNISEKERIREYCPKPSTPRYLEIARTSRKDKNGFTAFGTKRANVFLIRLFFGPIFGLTPGVWFRSLSNVK